MIVERGGEPFGSGGTGRAEGGRSLAEISARGAFDTASAALPAPGAPAVGSWAGISPAEQDGGQFGLLAPSGTAGLSCGQDGSMIQNAQKESSAFATNSFRTDAMRPPQSSALSVSLAAPCPLAGIWMNSKGILKTADFKKMVADRGDAPAPRLLFYCLVIHPSSFFILHSSFTPAPLPSLHRCARPSLAVPFRSFRSAACCSGD
jgi:hypothetical protein